MVEKALELNESLFKGRQIKVRTSATQCSPLWCPLTIDLLMFCCHRFWLSVPTVPASAALTEAFVGEGGGGEGGAHRT